MKKAMVIILFTLFSQQQLFAQSESTIINQLFSSSNEITQLSTDLISIGVDAVWFAEAVTGTVTQSPQNNDQWSYSASPNDKLIIIWANGDRLEYVFTKFEGWLQGDEEDFKESHSLDFTVYRNGLIDLHIVSYTYPEDGDEFYIKWQRNIQGDVFDNNEMMSININHNGQYNKPDLGSGIAIYRYWEEALGQATSNLRSFNISEGYWRTIAHNSNQGLFVLDTEIKNNSSVTINNIKYQFQNAHVFWIAYTQFADSAYVGAYNMVLEANHWIAEGTLLKNNQDYGSVQFNTQPVEDSYGPVLICKLGDGTEVLLHTLINPFVTDVEEFDELPQDYTLEQNYPNPFNPSTKIRYSIPNVIASATKQSQEITSVASFPRNDVLHVTLKIYDILGREVTTLVNKQQQPGQYEVKWNGANSPSGVYFYRIQIGDYTESKKMLLIK